MPARNPLSPQDVPIEWRPYIEWDSDEISGGKRSKLVTCPSCGEKRWIHETVLRRSLLKNLLCNRCSTRKVLRPKEVPEEWRQYIDWHGERERGRDGHYEIGVVCPNCNHRRMVSEHALRSGKYGSVWCEKCTSRRKGLRGKKRKRGHSVQQDHGYIRISIYGLAGRERDLGQQMADKSGYVLEHRLRMALRVNRPLTDKEIVHHRDGNRANNVIENLELLTRGTHYSGHGNVYYQKWQEALGLLSRAHDDVDGHEIRLKIGDMLKEHGWNCKVLKG